MNNGMRKIVIALIFVFAFLFVFIVKIDNLQEQMDYTQAVVTKRLNLNVLESVVLVTDGIGYGSGVAIQSNLILTAGHVVDASNLYIVDRYNNTCHVISKWRSNKYDIGFLWIDCDLSFIKLGNMPELLDICYLIGAPYSQTFELTITKGIISYIDRDWLVWNDLIQTDAEGAHGSSGCPLLNEGGKVIGICVAGPIDGGGVSLCEPVKHIEESLTEFLELENNKN